MSVGVEFLNSSQANIIVGTPEGQYSDVKAIEVTPSKLSNLIAAFANSDGGDLYIGIDERNVQGTTVRSWRGFANEEAANPHLALFERLFPLGAGYNYQFLSSDGKPGLVLHAQITRSQGIARASDGLPYIRRGAQSLKVSTPEGLKRLEYAKGVETFETETVNTDLENVTASHRTITFIADVVPASDAETWLRKQALIRVDKPTVGAVLLFADEPQAILPKRCGIKIYRYKTTEAEGFREALDFDPLTIEGPLYDQIRSAVSKTKEIAETIPKMGATTLESITYPAETLHEIVTNAVIHRDYSIADDVHIRIFDNRIEVQSPGRLPAHVTVRNILNERFARNGAVVRILNKFPDPPNKDVGEGLNTAFRAMTQLGLKEPVIKENDNSVIVSIRHETLASPEEAILSYLSRHETVNNREGRLVTHLTADYQMKAVFNRMVDKNLIEQVPGTRTSNTKYRLRR